MMILPIRKLLRKIRKTDWMGACLEKEPVQIEAATGKTIHQGLYPEKPDY